MRREGYSDSGLRFYLEELAHFTTRLRSLASIVLAVTSVNFIASLTVVMVLAAGGNWYDWFIAEMAAIPIFLTIVAIAAIWQYERYKRAGAVLYEELSDEFEWRISTGVRKSGSEEHHAPDIEARVTLRRYAATTDLWLAPGRAGVAIYSLVNLGFALLVVFAAVAQLEE